jgi:DNA-binding NarL/FixJ family response regulator
MDPRARILIIDDEASVRRALDELLKREGYATTVAEDGRRGLELALTDMPDIVLCDIRMPGFDGHQVLQALRADPRGKVVQFIFLTGLADRADQRSGMNLGADDYLAKPFTRAELIETVRVRLGRAAALEQLTGTGGFQPDFSSARPLESLGISPREAEVLLWVAQGKSNAEVAAILGVSEFTVKRHMAALFAKLGVENRNAAALCALERLR